MYRQHLNALVEAWNTGSMDQLDQYIHPEIVRHGPPSMNNSSANSLSDLKTIIADFRTAFPDLSLVLEEENYLEGRSVVRWTFTGTNTGQGDFEPTGKRVHVSGISLAHYEDELLKEEYLHFDTADFFSQLGLINLAQAATG
ncbi:MAG: SnoaL-like domain-containing protein [Pyrinomonadaceae bacterium]|nr:SnoaL-like domain-containing protein [Pyrinomonadaceae bacterium]